jgi:hypothetical protein
MGSRSFEGQNAPFKRFCGGGGTCGILSAWKALMQMNWGFGGICRFLGDFGEFLECLEWFRTYL